MKNDVSHKGRIVSITPQFTTVSISQESACSQCHAAGLCGMADAVEKAVQLPTSPYSSYREGDEVELVLKATMGLKAVWLAYCIPLAVLLAAVFGFIALGLPEVLSGLCAVAAVALYYLVLWLFRDKLRNEYIFTIKQ